jgi:hypothetical protein
MQLFYGLYVKLSTLFKCSGRMTFMFRGGNIDCKTVEMLLKSIDACGGLKLFSTSNGELISLMKGSELLTLLRMSLERQ